MQMDKNVLSTLLISLGEKIRESPDDIYIDGNLTFSLISPMRYEISGTITMNYMAAESIYKDYIHTIEQH